MTKVVISPKSRDYVLKTTSMSPQAMPRWMPRAAWLLLPPHLRECYEPNKEDSKPKWKVIPGIGRVPFEAVTSMSAFSPKMRAWFRFQAEKKGLT